MKPADKDSASKVAIVGSRGYVDLDEVRKYVYSLPTGTVVVTGGAFGVDEIALEAAERRGDLKWEIFFPDWNRYGKRAGAIRNQQIVDAADRVVAFWDGASKGTKITIDMARRAGKPLEIHTPRPRWCGCGDAMKPDEIGMCGRCES